MPSFLYIEALDGSETSRECKHGVTAFRLQESFFSTDGRLSSKTPSRSCSLAASGEAYVEVKGTEGRNRDVPAQINYSDSYREVLSFHF
jgi:hypothetical protein